MDRPAQQPPSQAPPPPPPPSFHSMQQNGPSQQRVRPCSSNFSLGFPRSATMQSLTGQGSQIRPSRTWTPSSVGLGLLSDADDVQDRSIFVLEYNRLAKKHGVRFLMVEDFIDQRQENEARSPEKRSWLHRLFRGSSTQQSPDKTTAAVPRPRHRRSVSDLGHLIHSRRDAPKHLEIQTMVRLSGRSVLYLPQEYSPCSLILPTCIRATAQHIAQNAMTRGLFRIPGSVKVVNSLFDYYCYISNDGVDVAGTVCCATLPSHIHYSVHDVASTFKRLLSVLPGGILGSLSLFDALIAIHSQLHGEPEFPRTKQTRVRARLIALAIGTIESQFRRELICGVFGLLSLIGRVAEVSPREDADGRPLPTGDLIGYNALGIVFGPLLIGELLEKYTMKLATPASGLLLFPMSPKRPRRERQKQKSDGSAVEPPPVNKVMVANDITEMLITNWRDVVRQMRALGTHSRRESLSTRLYEDHKHSSTSESFVIKMPQQMKEAKSKASVGRDHSPEPETPTMALNRRRSRPIKREDSESRLQKENHLSFQRSHDGAEVHHDHDHDHDHDHNHRQVPLGCRRGKSPAPVPPRTNGDVKPNHDTARDVSHCQSVISAHEHVPVSLEKVPPRLSSKHGLAHVPIANLPMLFGSGDEPSRPTGKYDVCDTSQQDEVEGQGAELNCLRSQAMGRSGASDSSSFEQIIPYKISSHVRTSKAHFVRLDSPCLSNGLYEACRTASNFDLRQAPDSEDPVLLPVESVPAEERKGKGGCHGIHNPLSSPVLSANTSGFRHWLTAGMGLEEGLSGVASDALASKDGSLLCHALTSYQSNGQTAHDHEQEQDASDYLSEHSDESQIPTKRKSVRAMAAMFESQQMLRQMAHSRRQPPPGGVEVSPLHKCTKELLERSHSFPQWAPQNSDRPVWIRADDHHPRGLAADANHRQTDAAVPTETTDERDGCGCGRAHICTSGCAREKCNLESRIENLGQRLNDKSAEVEILKRRLEGLGNGGSPSEQLSQARKELSFLRVKVDAADRKMKVLEKFTTKLREIRDSMMTESSRNSSANHADERLGGRVNDGKFGTSPQHTPRVRFAKLMKIGSRGRASDDSGPLGDETVVPARIRDCLYCSEDHRVALFDGARGEPNGVCALHSMAGSRDVQNYESASSELAAAQVWSAVEELLQMEDEETWRQDWSLPVV